MTGARTGLRVIDSTQHLAGLASSESLHTAAINTAPPAGPGRPEGP